MEQVSEQLHAFYYSRTGPGEVRVRIHRVDCAPRNLRNLSCELDRAFEPESTGRYDDHLRQGVCYILPVHAHRVFACSSEWVFTAGKRDHLGYPVAATE